MPVPDEPGVQLSSFYARRAVAPISNVQGITGGSHMVLPGDKTV